MTPALRPKAELLRCCARVEQTVEQRTNVARLAEAVDDWGWFVKYAHSGGTAALAHRTLSESVVVPERVRKQLKMFYLANALQNASMARELVRLLGALDAAGVRVVTYKGPALAIEAYGDLALRQFADLDIHVYEADARRAGAVLVDLGYIYKDNKHRFRTWPPRERVALEHAAFEHPERHLLVELQSRFMPRFLSCAFDYDGIWNRLTTLELEGATIRTLAPDDLIVVIAMHASKHCYERLEWVCGIAELVARRGNDIDWDAVLRRTESTGTQRMLLVALRTAQLVLDANLPPAIVRALAADPAADRLATRVTGWLGAPDRTIGGDERIAFVLETRERWRDRIVCAVPVVGHYFLLALHYAGDGTYRPITVASIKRLFATIVRRGIRKSPT